jgi:ribosomal subunit interface protein
MQMPVEIKAHGLTITDAQAAEIHEKVEKLERFYERIVRVRVTVEGPGGHHRAGSHKARIDLIVPGSEIVINRQSGKDVREALHEAFHAAGRCLEDYVRKVRGYVKHHPESLKAKVARTFPERGYGFLEDAGGREIYFHRNSVLNGSFDDLAPGAEVRFTEEAGHEGPQASTVVVAEH